MLSHDNLIHDIKNPNQISTQVNESLYHLQKRAVPGATAEGFDFHRCSTFSATKRLLHHEVHVHTGGFLLYTEEGYIPFQGLNTQCYYCIASAVRCTSR